MDTLTRNDLRQLVETNGKWHVFFKASKDSIREVELQDVPKNMEEALEIEDLEKHLGFQTNTDRGNRGANVPQFFTGRVKRMTRRKKSCVIARRSITGYLGK